ncbi:MAG: DUF2147 domain-containing protein [Fusobacteriaceae bacterium]
MSSTKFLVTNILLAIIFFGVSSSKIFAEESEDLYLGYWMMPNQKVIIQIEKNNEEYVGHVRWLKDFFYPAGDKFEGQEQFDRNNSDKSLRERKVFGLQVVGGLKKDSTKNNNKLYYGWIYDSWNGRKYFDTAEIIDKDFVKLRGSFDRFGILGKTMIIKRVPKP